jgi:hypothetical protein
LTLNKVSQTKIGKKQIQGRQNKAEEKRIFMIGANMQIGGESISKTFHRK